MSPDPLIVHATVEFGAEMWGGISTAVGLAAEATARAGLDTHVVTLGSAMSRAAGYRVTTLLQSLTPEEVYGASNRVELGRRLGDAMFDSVRALRQGRDVVVVVHNEELLGLVQALGAVAWCHRRFAYSHGLVGQEHPGRTELASQEASFLASVDHVFVGSDSQRRLMAERYPSVPVSVLALPLALLSELPVRLELVGVERQPGLLIAAGRAVRQKGFDVLVEAVRLLPEDLDAEIRIYAGHGDAEIEEWLRDAGVGRIQLCPWIAESALLVEFARAHAVVIPSRFEPLGLVAAEALSVQTPIVASRVGGLGELLGPVAGTLLVPPADDGLIPHALAEALARVLRRAPYEVDGRPRLAEFSTARFVECLAEEMR
jgi:glycosyltransferase involved in cell wall biosynthesis